MGRSGRGGGGGHSGGGRSGGSRSSGRSARSSSAGRSGRSSSFGGGGFSSSGSRPSGGFSGGGHPMGGGYQRPPRQPRPPRPPRRPWMFGWPYRRGFGGSTVIIHNGGGTYEEPPKRNRHSGIFTTIVVLLVFWVFMSVMFSFMRAGSMAGMNSYSVTINQITRSTARREKLQLGLSDASGYVTDECGWIRNKTTLINGLQDFYESTGILPYVYIIDNIAGDYDPPTEKIEQFAEEQYTALFADEGHALLVFWDYDGAYEYTLWLGDDAAELMDQEACDILFDYIDYYYYAADTEEAFFADAFADVGKRMMTVTRSRMDYVLPVIAVIVVAAVIFVFAKSAKEKQARRAKKAEEILNTPLEKFGSSEDVLDNLESKYEKEI